MYVPKNDMLYVLRIEGLVDGTKTPYDGQFLVRYDPDTPSLDPWGRAMVATVEVDPDPHKAMKFGSSYEALELWRTVSTAYPIRPWDGKPNRPLTAFTVTVDKIEWEPPDS